MTLRLLGRVDVRGPAGEPAAALVAQSKRLAVLAILAVDGGMRRDSLRALLWPESDDARARHALNQTLYMIRRAIGAEAIASVGPEQLQLVDDTVWCDATAFRQALDTGRPEDAAGLYEGDLLPGFHVADAPEFEEWLFDRRRGLRQAATAAVRGLVVHARDGKDWRAAVTWARRAVAIDPADEAALRTLMTALDRLGERGAAVREFRGVADRLERELGILPSPETRELIAGIMDAAVLESPEPAMGAQAASTVTEGTPADAGHNRSSAWPQARTSVGHPDSPARSRGATRSSEHARWPGFLRVAGIVAVLAGASLAYASTRAGDAGDLDPRRIIVAPLTNETGDPALDPIGGWAADWITAGLQATGLLEVVDPVTGYVSRVRLSEAGAPAGSVERSLALARAVAAGTVVWGSYRRAGDSLHITVRISDVGSGLGLQTLSATGLAANPAVVVTQLRSSVAGALAGALDDRVATLQPSLHEPPRLESYREYIAGLDLFVREEYVESVPIFLEAAQADSSFMLPRIWALFALDNSGQDARFDSLLATLVPLRAQLAPLDQFSVDFHVARRDGDHLASLQASRRAARIAPQSNWTYLVAMLAPDFNRPREAVAAIEQLSPTSGWAVGWPLYWAVRAKAHHIAKDHAEELRVLDEGAASVGRDPLLTRRIMALAALGRTKEVTALLDSVHSDLPLRATAGYEAGMDLRAHGYGHAAPAYFERAITDMAKAVEQNPDDPDLRRVHAQFLYFAGRWQEAEPILESLFDADSVHYDTYVMLAYSAARRADTARAWALVDNLRDHRITNRKGTFLFVHACVWALLGNKDEAVRYIRETLDAGYNAWQFHQDVNLESLWDYPPYLEAIRPRG